MNKIILITGATSGIGRATAIRFARENFDLIITGRRNDRLTGLSDELQNKYPVKVIPLPFDIRVKTEVEQALDSIPATWRKIDVLVNNAGLASGLDAIHKADMDDWETMIDTNIKGLLYVSRIIIPWMVENGKGHIINIGSIAGKEVYPKGNVYCATKFAVDAMTKGMRIDLLSTGIRVTQVSPGAVETEFSEVRFKGDKDKARQVYTGYEPLKGEDIADAIWFVTSLPNRVNINDMVIMPTAQAGVMNFYKK
jgi:3-hydroxy acid dehydrogenase/malonic semialdehyde reductase